MTGRTKTSKLVGGALLAALCILFLTGAATVNTVPSVWILDHPSITIAGATATATSTPSTGVHEAHIQWVFGTVAGSYGTCTAQAKTSFDNGATWLTLGSAESITVTAGTVNYWDIYQLSPSTSTAPTIVLSTASSSAALAFGLQTEFVFACSSYGTSAPVTITTIYR